MQFVHFLYHFPYFHYLHLHYFHHFQYFPCFHQFLRHLKCQTVLCLNYIHFLCTFLQSTLSTCTISTSFFIVSISLLQLRKYLITTFILPILSDKIISHSKCHRCIPPGNTQISLSSSLCLSSLYSHSSCKSIQTVKDKDKEKLLFL